MTDFEREPTPSELAELWKERSAIKEFCANLPRKQAEEEAFLEIYGEMEA